MILLCEDDAQEQLVRFYLKKSGLNTTPPCFIPINASRSHQIHGWARDNPEPGPTCVDSLRASLTQWRKIG